MLFFLNYHLFVRKSSWIGKHFHRNLNKLQSNKWEFVIFICFALVSSFVFRLFVVFFKGKSLIGNTLPKNTNYLIKNKIVVRNRLSSTYRQLAVLKQTCATASAHTVNETKSRSHVIAKKHTKHRTHSTKSCQQLK